MLNYEKEITTSKCPKCDTAYISEDGSVSVNKHKCAICGTSLHEKDIQELENHIKNLRHLKESPIFKPKNKHATFKSYLKPEVKLILNNLNNYLIRVHYAEPSICRYCNERIASSFLPLILWNKDQIHFIEFHVNCIIKKENLKEFIDFLDDFDYVYEIDE